MDTALISTDAKKILIFSILASYFWWFMPEFGKIANPCIFTHRTKKTSCVSLDLRLQYCFQLAEIFLKITAVCYTNSESVNIIN